MRRHAHRRASGRSASRSRASRSSSPCRRALNTRIANFALDGGDFAGAAQACLASPAFKQTPPRLMIWKIPERVLLADRRGADVRCAVPAQQQLDLAGASA